MDGELGVPTLKDVIRQRTIIKKKIRLDLLSDLHAITVLNRAKLKTPSFFTPEKN